MQSLQLEQAIDMKRDLDVREILATPPYAYTTIVGRSGWRKGDRPVTVGFRQLSVLERTLDAMAEGLVESFLIAATAKRVPVRKVDVRVEANVAPPVRPGKMPTRPVGPERARLFMTVDCDCDAQTLGRLVSEARATSHVFDMLASGVRVELVHRKA